MIAFLISLAPYIPLILSLVSFLMKMFGTSEETLAAYTAMVKRVNDAGLISVESHDRHMKNKQAILAEIQAEKDAAAKKAADSQTKAP